MGSWNYAEGFVFDGPFFFFPLGPSSLQHQLPSNSQKRRPEEEFKEKKSPANAFCSLSLWRLLRTFSFLFFFRRHQDKPAALILSFYNCWHRQFSGSKSNNCKERKCPCRLVGRLLIIEATPITFYSYLLWRGHILKKTINNLLGHQVPH